MKTIRVLDDIYAVPVNDLLDKELKNTYYILYAPKAGASSVVDKAFLDNINGKEPSSYKQIKAFSSTHLWEQVKSENSSSFSPEILYILPNYKCNLSCTYCYAAKGRSSKEIDKDELISAIHSFFSLQQKQAGGKKKKIRITFMGGGEPLLSWNIVKAAVEEAYLLATEGEYELTVTIITNGTILSDEILHTLKKYNIRVNVSFDITPQLQALQRGHHERVSKNIARMLDSGIKLLIRSTITPQSAPQLRLVAEYAVNHFNSLKQIAFEPVTDETLSPNKLRAFLETFRASFFEAKEYLSEHGISLLTSDIISSVKPSYRHCQGSISINPELSITACPCFSSTQEKGYTENVIGELHDSELIIDDSLYSAILPDAESIFGDCRDCYARWHCAGGCVHQRIVYTPEQMHEICRHTRYMLRMILFEKINNELKTQHNCSLKELLV